MQLYLNASASSRKFSLFGWLVILSQGETCSRISDFECKNNCCPFRPYKIYVLEIEKLFLQRRSTPT